MKQHQSLLRGLKTQIERETIRIFHDGLGQTDGQTE